MGQVLMVDGRSGNDTLILPEDRASYDIAETADGISIRLRDALGTETLANRFETFIFRDRELDFEAVLETPTYGARLRSPDAIGTEYADILFSAGQEGFPELNGGDDIALLVLGSFFVDGGAGGDRIVTGIRSDEIVGGAGADHIQADGLSSLLGGRDKIEGGPGDDLISGGPGRDTFIFKTDAGNDQIARFEIYEDGPSLIGPDFNTAEDNVRLEGFDDLTAAKALATLQNGTNGAVLELDEIKILFYGVDAADFTTSNFQIA